MLRGVDNQVCVGTSWGTGSTSSDEASWNCCLLHIEFYVVLQNSRVIDCGLHPHCFSELKAINHLRNLSLSFSSSELKDKHVLGTFITKICLPEQSLDFSRLPSFIPLFSVSDCVMSQIPMSFLSGKLQCFAKNETFFSSNSTNGVTEV